MLCWNTSRRKEHGTRLSTLWRMTQESQGLVQLSGDSPLGGFPHTGGIAVAISSLLKQSDEPMLIEEIVASLERTFGVANISVRSYCNAPMFVVEDGYVRLRADDEPYKIPSGCVEILKGCNSF